MITERSSVPQSQRDVGCIGINPSRKATWLEWLPVAIGLLALYVPTFYNLANDLWQQDDYAHGPIILTVILWLIWDKRAILLAAPTHTAPVTASHCWSAACCFMF